MTDTNKQYQVTLSEKQLHVLVVACELLARVGIGQLDFLDWLPLKDKRLFPHEAKRRVAEITKEFTVKNVDGWTCNLGIHNEQVDSESQIAWEMYQTFRHRLSWERAVAEGVVESIDSPRDWRKMMGVNYDEPMHITGEPFPKINKVEG